MKNIDLGISFTDRSDENVTRYFKDIARYKPLPTIEEKRLSEKIHDGDQKAFETLVKHNLRFVVSVAKKYQGRGLGFIDLINEGNRGLMTAAHMYNGKLGWKFISYAVWWIKQSIVQAIYVKSSRIYYPVGQSLKINRVNKAINQLSERLERDPSEQEISDKINVPIDEVKETLNMRSSYSSLDENYGTDDEVVTLENYIPSKMTADKEFTDSDYKDKFSDIINKIPDNRCADCVRLLFGISCRKLSKEEVANRFGMSPERIRQFREMGLDYLRKNCKEDFLELV